MRLVGYLLPHQGLNLVPWQWTLRVLTNGLPGNSNSLSIVDIILWAPDGATPAQSSTSAHWNFDNFCIPVNTPLDQKCNTDPVIWSPSAKPTPGFFTPKKADHVALANQLSFPPPPCSLFHKSFLPSTLFRSSPKGDCPFHQVLKFVLAESSSAILFLNTIYSYVHSK